MSDDRDYPEMAAARGRIEPAPRRVRGFLGHELVFDTTAARYVWEVPYYPQYYIPLADVRAEFLRDEDHPQKVQLGSSRLHSLVGAGQTHETAARVFEPTGARRGLGALRMGSAALARGGRADLRPSTQSVRARRRAAVAPPRPGESSTASCSPTPSPRSCCSKPACRQGITSTRPTSPSSIWNPATTRDAVPLQGDDVGLLVGAGRRHGAPGSGVDLPLPAAGRGADRRPGGVLQREARHHRRRCRVAAAEDAVQLTQLASRRSICAWNSAGSVAASLSSNCPPRGPGVYSAVTRTPR